jgi:hypothetical protein
MRPTTFLLPLFLFFSFTGNSQAIDSLRHKYNNQTIYRYGAAFLKGNERLTFKDLRGEFSMSDLGLASYTKARNYRTTSTILRYAAMLTGLASIGVAANNGNKNTVIILLGGQLALGLAGAKYGTLSSQNLDRALWQRNKDLLFPGRQQ